MMQHNSLAKEIRLSKTMKIINRITNARSRPPSCLTSPGKEIVKGHNT